MRTQRKRHTALAACLLLVAGKLTCAAQNNADPDAIPWREVTPEELAMTEEPGAAGAAAVYLYVQVDQNHDLGGGRFYQQLKVLNEQGRNRANIDISYIDKVETITGIDARVVQPDGTIVPFDGTIYDRPLVANRAAGLRSKSFTVPDVRVGSVVEYRYRRQTTRIPVSSRWILSQDLFTRLARFSLRTNPNNRLQWSWPRNLPEGTAPPQIQHGVVRLETRNIAAFVTEEHMPPADDMTVHVAFNYIQGMNPKSAAEYWREQGKAQWLGAQVFIRNTRGLDKVLAGIVAAGDSDEQKARKIYEHVRQKKNTELDPATRTASIMSNLRTQSANPVIKDGEGTHRQLQLYFIGLLRAAGLEAVPVLTAARVEQFFDPATMQARALNGFLAAVTLGGQDVLLDPGSTLLPYGQLHWPETAVPALKLDENGGQWITTPSPRPQDASIRRKARFALEADGTLEGAVKVSYQGHDAIWRIARLRFQDEQARREFLEEELRETLTTGAQVTLVREPDWTTGEAEFEVEYRVMLPQWATPSGSRMLLGIGIFGAAEKAMFVPATRQHPVYFPYAYTAGDEVEISLPGGYRLQSAPEPGKVADGTLAFSTSVTPVEGAVTVRRDLTQGVFLAQPVHYPRIRAFFQAVRSGDEGQLVLTR